MILLHGFGQRYDLPIGLALYLFAAGGVVLISFVLVVLFAGEQVGARAIEYPRRAVPWLVGVASDRVGLTAPVLAMGVLLAGSGLILLAGRGALDRDVRAAAPST